MDEVWKDVVAFPTYQISSFGNIRRAVPGGLQIITQYVDERGYLCSRLVKDRRPHIIRIHRLVAITFVDNKQGLPQVDHIDGDKTNNMASNLRWVSPGGNTHNPSTFSKIRRKGPKPQKIVIKSLNVEDMTVTLEQIRNIRPGATEAFLCDDEKMYAVAVAISTVKRRGMPSGVIDYEHKKFFGKGIIVIRALREGDVPMLNN